jgi:hypothetical protein
LKGDSKEGTQVDAITMTYGYNASWLAARESRKPEEPDSPEAGPIKQPAQPSRLLSRARLEHIDEEPVVSEVMRQMIDEPSHIAVVTVKMKYTYANPEQDVKALDMRA